MRSSRAALPQSGPLVRSCALTARTTPSPVLLAARAFSAAAATRRIWQPVPKRPQSIEKLARSWGSPLQSKRSESTASNAARPLTDRPDQLENEPAKRDEPAYEITFTCKPCLTRARHRITKHGYHKGTVLIACPHCKARHVISDHLKIFNDQSTTVEQILARRGETVKKGYLGGNGDMEFWDDGTSSPREDSSAEPSKTAEISDK